MVTYVDRNRGWRPHLGVQDLNPYVNRTFRLSQMDGTYCTSYFCNLIMEREIVYVGIYVDVNFWMKLRMNYDVFFMLEMGEFLLSYYVSTCWIWIDNWDREKGEKRKIWSMFLTWVILMEQMICILVSMLFPCVVKLEYMFLLIMLNIDWMMFGSVRFVFNPNQSVIS